MKIKCKICNKEFNKKPSRIKKSKLGNFCSKECSNKFKSDFYKGKNNPNYRNRIYDYDGYRIIHHKTKGRQKEHSYITKEILNLKEIPKGFHVHHRDCDILNNDPKNLVLLNISDHQWLHKQFGNATLWAFMNNKISEEKLISWSTDKNRAKRLLNLHLEKQIGFFKSRELLED